MYKIGEFAKLVNTSISLLRYYDDIEIFEPDEIDITTNYRYYTEEKVKEFEFIKELQSLGFTNPEIKKYKQNLTDEILLIKKNKILESITENQNKIKEIDKLRSHLLNGKSVYKKLERGKYIWN